ncbi:MAG: SdrD B-like domain-containing protein [Saprospiraceae bacterium]
MGNGATKTVTPAATTTYTVTVTDGNGCTSTDQVVVNVLVLPDVIATGTPATCNLTNGIITLTFPDESTRTGIEFSIDGGVTYPFSTPDNVGSYQITGLAPGTYDIWARWGNDDCPVNVTPDVTIMEAPCASLGDYVWEDRDADGQQDSNESGIEGVVVMLLDENGAMLDQTTTNASGFYSFTDLTP